MSYDNWKATNAADEFLGPPPISSADLVRVAQISREIARLEASRQGWPGLDSEQEEYVAAEIADLRDELISIEEE